ncbi:hypothetical protein Tco_1184692 [Tanacetum coccineum]
MTMFQASSQLENHGAVYPRGNANQKFFLDLYPSPSLKFLNYEEPNQVTQNVAFVFENTSSTNDVSTTYSVSNPSGQNSQYEQTSSYSLLANQSSCPQLDHEDLEQLDEYDLE